MTKPARREAIKAGLAFTSGLFSLASAKRGPSSILEEARNAMRRANLDETRRKHAGRVRERLEIKYKKLKETETELLKRNENSQIRNQLNQLVEASQEWREEFLKEYLERLKKATYLETEQMMAENAMGGDFVRIKLERTMEANDYPNKKTDLEILRNIMALYTKMVNETQIALFDKLGSIQQSTLYMKMSGE